MNILGISAYYHDSSACILVDGNIIAAVQEERFTRLKHDKRFPSSSIKYCLNEANLKSDEIDYVVFYEKPFLKFERLIETYLAFAPRGFKSFIMAIPIWIKEKLFQKKIILNELKLIFGKKFSFDKLLFSEHHLSHAASAFYPSPFETAAILTLDAVGEWSTSSLSVGEGKNIHVLKEINFPHSLGLLYSAFTYYLGFKVNSGEYKLMGLAPFGKAKYVDLIKEHLIDIKDDGSFKLNMNYFDYCTGLKMINKRFEELFGGKTRKPESDFDQRHMDIAASIQKVTEEVILRLAKNIKKETNQKNLCLAGGVALNCVANGALKKSKIFDNLWIQPASGDAGGSVGSALAIWHIMLNNKREPSSIDKMSGSYLGPSYSNSEIESSLKKIGATFNKLEKSILIKSVAKMISNNKAIGWMQGRMEFGPRALGNRSILADPRSPYIQNHLNLMIKYRESFRPFAPSVLFDKANEWFEEIDESPYMLLVTNVKKEKCIENKTNETINGLNRLKEKRSIVPAITHIDFSARVQTVCRETNETYYNLIYEFFKITGCPLLVNTSFNVRGEPIVCSPEDAFKCFMGTELDALVIGDYILLKKEQNKNLVSKYTQKYELD